ncbi:helix-turn-helix domain-containing protein [Micromonospora sp. CPCC 206171]|uniref:helix-turn-helix domain-containing protein n=1 Tax=Micromonospora sp. CPCC 206171 TaxID=3122405 RepID=UPI002FF04688
MSNETSHPASSQFVIVPYALMQALATGEVSAPAYGLYSIIKFHWGGFKATFPHQDTIAEKSGMSVSTVKRLLKELSEKGWILKERQKRVHGDNEYWLCDVPFTRHANAPKAAPARKRSTPCGTSTNQRVQQWNSPAERQKRQEFAVAKKQRQEAQVEATQSTMSEVDFGLVIDGMDEW